jgi:hypothetical protein
MVAERLCTTAQNRRKWPVESAENCVGNTKTHLWSPILELALFNLAIDSKLRGCDLVGLHVRDVLQGSHVTPRANVMQKKTQRSQEPSSNHVHAWAIASSYESERPADSAAVKAASPSAPRARAIRGAKNASSAGSR